ncbi:MAG: hypothetical protein GF417_00840 [Candidatus Latescibacteria bacterium]|nr:hypothetical protein [bacterium]MBD3422972.1 hypothetical protein [Candidatus Latescibacterota bacterium]
MARKNVKIINLPETESRILCLELDSEQPYYRSDSYRQAGSLLMEKKGRRRIPGVDCQRAAEEMNCCLAAYSPAMVKLLSEKGGADCEH